MRTARSWRRRRRRSRAPPRRHGSMTRNRALRRRGVTRGVRRGARPGSSWRLGSARNGWGKKRRCLNKEDESGRRPRRCDARDMGEPIISVEICVEILGAVCCPFCLLPILRTMRREPTNGLVSVGRPASSGHLCIIDPKPRSADMQYNWPRGEASRIDL